MEAALSAKFVDLLRVSTKSRVLMGWMATSLACDKGDLWWEFMA